MEPHVPYWPRPSKTAPPAEQVPAPMCSRCRSVPAEAGTLCRLCVAEEGP